MTKQLELERAILYILARDGESMPRALAAELGSNVTDVNKALNRLRTLDGAVEREAIRSRDIRGDKFKHRLAAGAKT